MVERALAGLVVVPFLLGAAVAPVSQAPVVFSFQDREITESSGLVEVDGLVVTTNDSGDTGRVFVVDPADGRTVGTTTWADDPTDVEALAPDGQGGVWVGDIGDNGESRETVQVADVPVGPGDRSVEPTVFDLAYPDGPHNAETLMTDPTTGRLYVATKGVLGGTLYAAPATLRADAVNELEPLGSVLAIATDGAFLPGGTQVVIRNYGLAVVYAFPSLEEVAELRLPAQEQGEGIAVAADGSLLLSSEGVRSDVLRVNLPSTAPAAPAATASPQASEPPRTESREDSELPESTESQRPEWPWFLTGLLGIGFIWCWGGRCGGAEARRSSG